MKLIKLDAIDSTNIFLKELIIKGDIKNFTAVIDALTKEKANNTLKGDLIKNTYLTSTMGVSYKLKLDKNI